MTPSLAEVEALVTGGRIDRLLQWAGDRRRPVSVRRWLLDALERALVLADPGGVTAEQRDAAIALGVDADTAAVADVQPPPHGVRVPFAPLSGAGGFVRTVYVAWRASPDGTDARWSSASRDAVRRALELATRFATPGRGTDGYALVASQPEVLEALHVHGRSLGAATFVSAVALWSDRAVRPGTVITGELTATGVASVGGLATKLEGVLSGRPDVTRLIVPSRNVASVRTMVEASESAVPIVGVASLEALLEAALAPRRRTVRPGDAVAEARQKFERGWQGWRWPGQREPLERLAGELPERRLDLRVEVATMLGAVTRHLGAPDESLSWLEQARALAESEEGREAVPDLPLTELHQHLALTLRQLCRFGEAAREARRAIAIAARARLRGERLKAHGCAGLVELSRGRAGRAVDHQRAALEVVHRHRPESCPRTHGYLIEALGRAGDLDGARRQYREGMDHLARQDGGGDRTSREVWLRTSYAAALTAGGRFADVRRTLEVEPVERAIAEAPLPGLLARRWLGLARAAGKRPEEGYALLAGSVAAHGRGLLPHVRFLAHLNVLCEATARLERGRLGRDGRERARIALGHLPAYGEADRWLGPAARSVALSLGSGHDEKLARDLSRLIERAQRIA